MVVSSQLAELNQEQTAAVTAGDGPVLVLAGAGSGKTKVLTYRIAYLLETKGIHPEQILALTFTNKAAGEMKERVQTIVEGDAPSWVSTFHAACVRILRREIDLLGYGKDFLIYDTRDKTKIVKDLLADFNLDKKKYPHQAVAKKISGVKNNLQDPRELFYPYDEVFEAYQKRLKKENALDFDDLLLLTLRLFEQYPDRLQYYQNKFQYILVDEFQDTNPAQNRLISLLSPPQDNVFVVGDDDQSIYLFRGADVKNILEFEKTYPNAQVYKLEKNYRSSKTILEAANQVVTNNPSRKSKELWTDNDEGYPLQYYEADDERDEAYFIAEEIRANRYQLPLIAVLYRTNAQSRVLEDIFRKMGISYEVVGGTGFYDRKEVKDIMAYLMVVQCPQSDSQLERIINEPKRGIGKTSVDKLKDYANRNNITLFDALLEVDYTDISKRGKNSVKKFTDMIGNFRKMREYLTVRELIEEVAEKSGYLEALRSQNTKEAETRMENVREIYSMAKEFEAEGGETLQEFLTHSTLMGDIDTWEDEEQAQVVMMTLHSAKGLEFPGVFLTGLEEGVFPHIRTYDSEASMEEERRLCYVGITRAEQVLYLTWARERTLNGMTRMLQPSRFVSEIGEDLKDTQHQTLSGQGQVTSTQNSHEPPQTQISSFSDKTSPSGKRNVNLAEESYQEGDLISHKKWGEGKVLQAQQAGSDWVLTVSFDGAGIKKLAASVAPIKKLK
ncbi:ATP-dependent helicase [Natranaerobius thermophilus]|uniref:DNA 3'-5' helicase n=1 Tax=Natranaerobius thermophilus (strain ATCC BAA-1301 / DSM 18059 / JW/NM-WN-LF) TaxID=457570 RepID=B2A5W4_NATTJ|nr:UvrD-helicase domain-containing protein [Natranaerobius thermophilus]ACB84057.1 UvrD/REP helicase [Natranaerobius thermophilus JW/NM-WN-LF]